MPIKKLVRRLLSQHEYSNPFQIAKSMGMVVIETPLDGIRGFYQYIHRCHIIYVDSSLEENDRLYVCAHELGHALLHKGMNRIFMDTRTLSVSSRYEKEADRFAVCLLYSHILEDFSGCTSYQLAQSLNISEELAAWLLEK